MRGLFFSQLAQGFMLQSRFDLGSIRSLRFLFQAIRIGAGLRLALTDR